MTCSLSVTSTNSHGWHWYAQTANKSETNACRLAPALPMVFFENKTSLNEFFGSRIEWKRSGGWKVRLRDGSEYAIRGCAPNSKPGLCAMTEIKNAQGDRLSLERDREGNILRITSPHGHTVSIQHDSEGRITQAVDDAVHWVKFEYDEHGSLKKAVNWSGATQRFLYNARFNMISAQEITPAPKGRPVCQVTVRKLV